MPITTAIERLLRSRPDDGLCMRCVATELRLGRIYTPMAKLEGYPGFRRVHGTCTACKKARLVLRYVGYV